MSILKSIRAASIASESRTTVRFKEDGSTISLPLAGTVKGGTLTPESVAALAKSQTDTVRVSVRTAIGKATVSESIRLTSAGAASAVKAALQADEETPSEKRGKGALPAPGTVANGASA